MYIWELPVSVRLPTIELRDFTLAKDTIQASKKYEVGTPLAAHLKED